MRIVKGKKVVRSSVQLISIVMAIRKVLFIPIAILCAIFVIILFVKSKDSHSKSLFILGKASHDEVKQLEYDVDSVRQNVRSLRALLEEVSCNTKGIGARGGFCLKPEEINVGYNDLWDMKLCGHLEDSLFKDQEIGDFGAGLGWYGMYWTRQKKPFFKYGSELEIKNFFNKSDVMNMMRTPQMVRSYQGFDGAGNVEIVTNGFIKYLDLSEKQNLGVLFDWVFSLEVGEHIPHEFETTFIENLISHACKGVVLSWAVLGQLGHFHVNNHDNDYVKNIFATYGFHNLLSEETKFRSDLNLGHLHRTLMVFERDTVLDNPRCPQH